MAPWCSVLYCMIQNLAYCTCGVSRFLSMFLWVFSAVSTRLPKHAGGWIGWIEWLLGVNKCSAVNWDPVWGEFFHLALGQAPSPLQPWPRRSAHWRWTNDERIQQKVWTIVNLTLSLCLTQRWKFESRIVKMWNISASCHSFSTRLPGHESKLMWEKAVV